MPDMPSANESDDIDSLHQNVETFGGNRPGLDSNSS